MDKYFSLSVDVVNGELKDYPQMFYFKCNEAVPIGQTIIRYFNDDMCSVAHKTFYIQYKQDLFGTSQFTTTAQFWDFTGCYAAVVFAEINGCNLKINGRNALIT